MCIQQASHVSECDKGILGRYYRWLTETQKFHHTSADSLIQEHLEYRENPKFDHFVNVFISGRPVSYIDPNQLDWKSGSYTSESDYRLAERDSPELSRFLPFSRMFEILHYFQYFEERERTGICIVCSRILVHLINDSEPSGQIHKRGDDFHRSMRRLQEKASVMGLDQTPACRESRAIRGLEWAWVGYFYRMLVSLGLSKVEAEDKVAQWLKSRVDNILACKGQDELDWDSETVGLESLEEIISEELLSTRKHPIRCEFAFVELEKGAGIDVLIKAWFDAFHELRVDCGVEAAAEEGMLAWVQAAENLDVRMAAWSDAFHKLL
ncbi:hypothetical protein B0H11DRAFT_2182590 [Mycena galericulata]|nr:hypothetical protein B0H11DRAFT_2182590 [Mycena galericulata]